ncbi:GMP/IMP nucleotidase YrfG [Striga asiatica]|uniref:GMP/IMP nucleotidase YrfG n=1 Tax=Striga asiatica TaxID=4170 RepID=A0A5A7Q8Z3_STRAF|nr:GMP/IMP nucleotidase YrfG [Striga asiatica]
MDPSLPLKSLPAYFEYKTVLPGEIDNDFLSPDLSSGPDLDENPIIQRLHIFHIIRIKNADNIILLQYEMVGSIEFDFSPCILGIHHLDTTRRHLLSCLDFNQNTVTQWLERRAIVVAAFTTSPRNELRESPFCFMGDNSDTFPALEAFKPSNEQNPFVEIEEATEVNCAAAISCYQTEKVSHF